MTPIRAEIRDNLSYPSMVNAIFRAGSAQERTQLVKNIQPGTYCLFELVSKNQKLKNPAACQEHLGVLQVIALGLFSERSKGTNPFHPSGKILRPECERPIDSVKISLERLRDSWRMAYASSKRFRKRAEKFPDIGDEAQKTLDWIDLELAEAGR